MQHGEALPKSMDPERPLDERGIIDAGNVAAAIPHEDLRVVHSGKLRARMTAEAFSKTPEAIEGIAPNDSVEEFGGVVDRWTEDTLVVGHLPFLQNLVAHLADGAEVDYSPGTVACLERDENSGWTIAGIVRPESLR